MVKDIKIFLRFKNQEERLSSPRSNRSCAQPSPIVDPLLLSHSCCSFAMGYGATRKLCPAEQFLRFDRQPLAALACASARPRTRFRSRFASLIRAIRRGIVLAYEQEHNVVCGCVGV